MTAALQHGPRPLPLFLEMLRNETAASPQRLATALAGLRAYQAADRAGPAAPPPVADAQGRAMLFAYAARGRPVVFVPSLINPSAILDLTAETSLLRWLATQGVRPLLVDWGDPTPADRSLDIAGHVEQLLIPMLARLPEPPVLVGYCLGGTMATAAALLAPVAGLATIASPWHFAGYGEAARAAMGALWANARVPSETLGVVPTEVLQAAFWRLDPARTIAKYEAFATMPPGSAAARAFVALEDWANAGAPLTYAAGADLFERFVGEDMPGRGEWHVAGRIIDPGRLSCTVIDFVSTSDRIVPAATAAPVADQRRLNAGHVGMIVGRHARAQLWAPLAGWIAALRQAT